MSDEFVVNPRRCPRCSVQGGVTVRLQGGTCPECGYEDE